MFGDGFVVSGGECRDTDCVTVLLTESDEFLARGGFELEVDREVRVGAKVVTSGRGFDRVEIFAVDTLPLEEIWVHTVLVVGALTHVDQANRRLGEIVVSDIRSRASALVLTVVAELIDLNPAATIFEEEVERVHTLIEYIDSLNAERILPEEKGIEFGVECVDSGSGGYHITPGTGLGACDSSGSGERVGENLTILLDGREENQVGLEVVDVSVGGRETVPSDMLVGELESTLGLARVITYLLGEAHERRALSERDAAAYCDGRTFLSSRTTARAASPRSASAI